MRVLFHNAIRYLLCQAIRLFRLRSSTDRIARGFAVGMTVHFFPTFGFGVLVSAFLARLCGGNLVAGFIAGSLFAFAWPFLFYFNIKVGSFFWETPFKLHDFNEVNEKAMHALMWGTTFTIGAIINSVITGLASYFLVLKFYQRIRPYALHWLRHQILSHRSRRFQAPMQMS